jgi:hypothetical protein
VAALRHGYAITEDIAAFADVRFGPGSLYGAIARRRRYGKEFRELIETQPFSIGALVDVIAGAIDAWLHPELSRTAPGTGDAKGELTMVARMMQLTCAGYGPQVSAADVRKSNTITIGGTLILVSMWLVAVWQFKGNQYVLALSPLTYFLPLLLGSRYTSLKGRPADVQAIFVVGLLGLLMAISLLAAWISVRY